MRVLLVEDSPLLSGRLLEQLAGVPAVEPLDVVATEAAAVAAIATQHPELVILDLHLKQGTGFGVLAAVAQMPKPPVAIVLTNYALPQYRERAHALGARYFLDKSYEFDRLPAIIAELSQGSAA